MGFKTQEEFYRNNGDKQNNTNLNCKENSYAVQQNNFVINRPQTHGGRARDFEGDLFDDPQNNLHGNLDLLSKEDFKERLIVAEKVMKSLFKRNKELEEKAGLESKITATTS